MKTRVEDIQYRDYLKKVEKLNTRKAYLSTYRHVLAVKEKKLLIKEIEGMEVEIEKDENQMQYTPHNLKQIKVTSADNNKNAGESPDAEHHE